MWVHSTLFSHAVQDGELAAIDCPVLGANRDPLRDVEDVGPPPDGKGMSARPVQTLYS